MRTPLVCSLLALLWLGCASRPAVLSPLAAEPEVELVESSPVETTLDNPDLREAWQVWAKMIGAARERVDLAQFYVSNAPGSRLEPIIQALEAAAGRGVQVRLLAEEKFARTYPETLERLAARPNIQVRRLDTAQVRGSGVMHAKYFIVDGREAFLGSQNFDWRALEHIQELGLRLRVPGVIRALEATFAWDWAQAAGQPPPATERVAPGPFSARFAGQPVQLTPLFSPQGALPESTGWDLPRLVELIDSARRSVRVQLLSYKATRRDGTPFPELQEALQRAAARGVRVELLLADWSKRRGQIENLQSLHAPPGLTVRLVSVPRASSGFIPFARVVHAKYMVVDGERAWLGTSNWEGDYFTHSRNVGVLVEGPALASRLERFFQLTWSSPYATDVDPAARYEPPSISSESPGAPPQR